MVKGKIYRYTGALPGTGADVGSNLNFTSWDSNASLSLYPIKRGAATVYSYIVALAYYYEADPGTVSQVRIWPSLVGGSLDNDVLIKIATTLQTTYKQATGTIGDNGTSIASLYSGVTVEDFFNYSSGSPKRIYGSDLVLTTGIGRYTKFILLQAEYGPAADLGSIPASGVTMKINHEATVVPA